MIFLFPLGISLYRDPFEWDFLGRNLFSMLIQGALYFVFTILIEYKFFCNRRYLVIRIYISHHVNGQFHDLYLVPFRYREKYYNSSSGTEDVDVAQEREKVLSGQTKDSVLRLENLTKVCCLSMQHFTNLVPKLINLHFFPFRFTKRGKAPP